MTFLLHLHNYSWVLSFGSVYFASFYSTAKGDTFRKLDLLRKKMIDFWQNEASSKLNGHCNKEISPNKTNLTEERDRELMYR